MRIEKEIDDLNNRINSLQIEAENHRKIIMESGSAVFGAKGSLKRNSKQRLEQVESEICQAKNRIRELEKKLSGDYE